MLLTIGAAIAFFVLVVKVCADVWVGNDPVDVAKVYTAVTISLSITFGSAFVGWLGLSSAETGNDNVNVTLASEGSWQRTKIVGQIVRQFAASLSGAALVAMFLYLAAGALAGGTYVFDEANAPAVIVTVATAWAAQASAIIASTLAVALKAK